jgi:hypothetical protein
MERATFGLPTLTMCAASSAENRSFTKNTRGPGTADSASKVSVMFFLFLPSSGVPLAA